MRYTVFLKEATGEKESSYLASRTGGDAEDVTGLSSGYRTPRRGKHLDVETHGKLKACAFIAVSYAGVWDSFQMGGQVIT